MIATRRALAALLVLGALAGCGDDATTPAEQVGATTEPGPPVEWIEGSVPLERGADTAVLTGVDGDAIVMVTASEDGDLQSAVAAGEGPFEPGPPLATGLEHLNPGAMAHHDDAWWLVAQGGTQAVPSRPDDWELTFDLHVFTSPDGLTWTAVEATGLDDPGRFEALVATDDGFAAVGDDEGANVEGDGSFTPLAWHSSDGVAWEEVALPGMADEDWVVAVVVVDDGLLAVGHVGGAASAWRSTDGGASWVREEPEGIPSDIGLADVVPVGDALLASGSGTPAFGDDESAAPLVFRSTDGGRTWSEAPAPEVTGAEEPGAPLHPIGGRALVFVPSSFEPWSDPAVCYADIEQCRGDSDTAVYVGDGTEAWERVDLSALDLGDAEIDGVVATDDRMVLHTATEGEILTWSAPADATFPTAAEPSVERADVTLLDEDDEPEVGVRYAAPLHIHCGMDWLYLGSEPFRRTDGGPDVETGAGDGVDEDWPTAFETIFGYATLGDDGTVEYAIGDGEVIATYARADEEPPGCE